jgi:hypothetical protein
MDSKETGMSIRQILVVAALATVVAVPAASDAQYRQDNRRNDSRYDRRQDSEIERLVSHAERQSNGFRRQVERLWDSGRERDWSRGWDREWSGGRDGGRGDGRDHDDHRDSDYGQQSHGDRGRDSGSGYQGDRGRDYGYGRGGDWSRDSRYSRRYGPKQAVQRLDEALEDLRDAVTHNRYDRGRHNFQVGRSEMMEVVRAADNVDFYFGRNRGHNSTLDREWEHVKHDIEPIARFYGVRMFGRW